MLLYDFWRAKAPLSLEGGNHIIIKLLQPVMKIMILLDYCLSNKVL